MKKMINIRNYLLTILCITIICLGVGFIVLSTELKKEKNKNEEFNVSFTSVDKYSSIKGGKIEPITSAEIQDNNLSVNLKYSLNEPHDEVIYIAKIKNKGDKKAEIVNLLLSPDFTNSYYNQIISPVKIEINDLSGKVLKPGDEIEARISAYYNPPTQQTQNKQRSFEFKIGLLVKEK